MRPVMIRTTPTQLRARGAAIASLRENLTLLGLIKRTRSRLTAPDRVRMPPLRPARELGGTRRIHIESRSCVGAYENIVCCAHGEV